VKNEKNYKYLKKHIESELQVHNIY